MHYSPFDRVGARRSLIPSCIISTYQAPRTSGKKTILEHLPSCIALAVASLTLRNCQMGASTAIRSGRRWFWKCSADQFASSTFSPCLTTSQKLVEVRWPSFSKIKDRSCTYCNIPMVLEYFHKCMYKVMLLVMSGEADGGDGGYARSLSVPRRVGNAKRTKTKGQATPKPKSIYQGGS